MSRALLFFVSFLLASNVLAEGPSREYTETGFPRQLGVLEALRLATSNQMQSRYFNAEQRWLESYRKMESAEERDEFTDKHSRIEYAPRFLKLAESDPKDAGAFHALTSIIYSVATTRMPEFARALELLERHQAGHPLCWQVCLRLREFPAESTQKFLRSLLQKSKRRRVLAHATFSLASCLKRQVESGKFEANGRAKEAIRECKSLLQCVTQEYADVDGLGVSAADCLTDLRVIAIGKPIPEFEMEDLDGKKFKLSDYRGKVIILDFWSAG